MLSFTPPKWFTELAPAPGVTFPTAEARMRLVLDFLAATLRHKFGGPFAAALFDARTGSFVAAGVNLVRPTNQPVLHAEIVALFRAHEALGIADLAADGGSYELVTSGEPCAMCLGAVHWSGIRSLVVCSPEEDIEVIGFDEGLKPERWKERLEAKGIKLISDVLREEGKTLLEQYRRDGGVIYNSSL